MKPAQIVVLAIALAAAGGAAFLVSRLQTPAPVVQAPVAKTPTVDVLVARGDIGFGQTISPDMLQWQSWTESSAGGNFIRRDARPDAMKELSGSIVRQPFVAGEPIREAKLVNATGSGFMAAILPPGKRAVSTEISAETGAGGFILPNDRVDVVLTKREKSAVAGGPETIRSQVVLSNIRVLAIDQLPKEKDGQNYVVGRTATLELSAGEVETLAKARQSGTLSLALRSMADRDVTTADNNSRVITIFRGASGSEVLSCNPTCAR